MNQVQQLNAVFIALSVCYLTLFLIGLYLNFGKAFAFRKQSYFLPHFKLYVVLFQLVGILRAILNLTIALNPNNDNVIFFGQVIPDIVAVSTYISFLLCWGELYHISHDRASVLIKNSPERNYRLHGILVFLLGCAITVVTVTHECVKDDEKTSLATTAILYMLPIPATLLFMINEYLIFRGNFDVPKLQLERYPYQTSSLRGFALVSLWSLLMFSFRGIYVLLGLYRFEVLFDVFFFFFVADLIPLSLQLHVIIRFFIRAQAHTTVNDKAPLLASA